MLKNVKLSQFDVIEQFATMKHVGKFRNRVSILLRNSSRRKTMQEDGETVSFFRQAIIHYGEACWKKQEYNQFSVTEHFSTGQHVRVYRN
jgi:hypothetical protein